MTRKIYAIGDVHSDVDALSTFANYVKSQEDEEAYVVCNGDLLQNQFNIKNWLLHFIFDTPTFLENLDEFTNSQFKQMKQALDSTGIPYHLVHGNYEPPKETGEFFGDNFIHDKKINLNGNTLYGQGGADVFTLPTHISRIWRPIDYEPDILEERISADDSDYLLLHNPFSGLLDKANNNHVGVDITHVLEDHAYKAVFSGHIHGEGPLGNIQKGSHSGIAYYVNSNREGTFAFNPGNLGKTGKIHPLTLEMTQPDPYFGLFAEVEINDEGIPIKLTQYSLAPQGELVDTPFKIAQFDLTKTENMLPGTYFSEHLEKIPGFVIKSAIQPKAGRMPITPSKDEYSNYQWENDVDRILDNIDIDNEFRQLKQDESIPQEIKDQFSSPEEYREFIKSDIKKRREQRRFS